MLLVESLITLDTYTMYVKDFAVNISSSPATFILQKLLMEIIFINPIIKVAISSIQSRDN